VRELEARNTELKGLLDDTVGRRKSAVDELGTVRGELEQERSGRLKAEGDLRMRASVDAVSQAVPTAYRQQAIDALYRLQAEGHVDLRGEDRDATVKAATEALRKSYASYFEEPTRAPRIPGVNTNGVSTQRLGTHNAQGERML
jgi:hypothetical protein